MIIGDVRGKGLDAVRLASIVLGSYRHVAYERADLRAIVADLDRAVARSVGDEDFVTAALVEERGGTLTIVNCGHPAPLLLRRGEVIPLEPPAPAPPLGFMPVARPRVERLEPGDRLLLYTDGLAEARRDGEFFPTAERAWRLLGHGTVGRRAGLAGDRAGRVGARPARRRHRPGAAGVRRTGRRRDRAAAELGGRRRRQLTVCADPGALGASGYAGWCSGWRAGPADAVPTVAVPAAALPTGTGSSARRVALDRVDVVGVGFARYDDVGGSVSTDVAAWLVSLPEARESGS